MAEYLLLIWFVMVFVLGTVIGSGLNVCIYRIPYDKSFLWPGSHCGNCFQPIRWFDNIPLLSYWLLRRRCRSCKTYFSPRYFLIELLTGIIFVALFSLDIVYNIHGNIHETVLESKGKHALVREFILLGVIPLKAWIYWFIHALLASFLIVTTFCDFDHMEIPLTVTITGTIVGLIVSVLFPWPWPLSANDIQAEQRYLTTGRLIAVGPPPRKIDVQEVARTAAMSARAPTPLPPINLRVTERVYQLTPPRPDTTHTLPGLQLWPVWKPSELPSWMRPGTWQLGLATSLGGILAGMIVLRGVRFLFGLGRGKEGLGVGDADLMMMAGAFLGWQAVVLAFFLSVFPALVLGVAQLLFRGDQMIPFGPSLALGTLLTLYLWPWLGKHFSPVFFDSFIMLAMLGIGAFFLLVISFGLRLLRGVPEETETA